MKNKIYAFVTTHFDPDFQYGGVVESGTRLFKYLSRFADFRLSAVSKRPQFVNAIIGNKGRCYRSIFFHRFGLSLDACIGLFFDILSADAILINGIFTFPVTLAQLYSVICRKPFIVATRGGLEPWRLTQKKWKKYFYVKFLVLPLMRRARFIHVTSDFEEQSIRSLGFNNTVKVTNGIDLELYEELPEKYTYKDYRDGRFIFLFMSRTDKEKGLDILVEAYRELCQKHNPQDFLLLIVGPDHQGYLKHFKLDFSQENIIYINGVYGNDKIELLRRADVVVLPSYSENFGNIIAESLICGTPVITTTGTPWKAIGHLGCGLYIQPVSSDLFSAMEAMYLTDKRDIEKMGQIGRNFIKESFSWDCKAKELLGYLSNIN